MKSVISRYVLVIVIAAGITVPAAPVAQARGGLNFAFNVLVPGRGQAQRGRYTRAAILGGGAVAAWAGLMVTQIDYNRAVDEFNAASTTYNGYRNRLSAGEIVAQMDIDDTWTEVNRSFQSADHRYTVRNLFIGGVVLVYALNFVDLLTSETQTGELDAARVAPHAPSWRVNLTPDRFALEKTFHF